MPRPAKGVRLYYARKDDRWVIRDTGQPDVGTGCRFGERAAAERELEKYLTARHRPDFGRGDPAHVLITDILMLYVEERAPDTRRQDIVVSAMPHLIDFFAGRTVSQATPSACATYVRRRTSQPQARYKVGPGYRHQSIDDVPRVGAQTARRELALLSSAIGYAYREHRIVSRVPIKLPAKAPSRDRWLTRSEAARMVWAALGFRPRLDAQTGKTHWRRPGVPGSPEREASRSMSRHVARFLLVALYTGTRHDAILKLSWIPSTQGGHVDLRAGMLYRRGAAEGESNKRRTPSPISRRLLAHLRRWQGQSVSRVVEFEGKPIARMRRSWHTARKAAGLGAEVTPHILKHTFCTWAVSGGMPFGLVGKAVGTSERVIVETYGHHAPEHLRSVVEFVSGGRRT